MTDWADEEAQELYGQWRNGNLRPSLIAAALRKAKKEGMEEAAKIAQLRALVFGGEPTTDNERLIVEHIVQAIRAASEKQP